MFVFTVAFSSIPKKAKNQFWNLSLRKDFLELVNKQMLACKFIEKVLYSRRFAWNKLSFFQELFSLTSLKDVPKTPANI